MKIILVLSAVLCLSPVARSCAIFEPQEEREASVEMTDESALIVWDEKTRTEHFIRQANFSGATKEFGFIVPTPSKPSLGKTKNELFETLEGELEPSTETYIDVGYRLFYFFPVVVGGNPTEDIDFAGAISANATDGECGFEIVQQTRVGDYDATVLRAHDAKALRAWLNKNSFTAALNVEKWLQFYTEKNWYLTAFRIRSGQKSKNVSLAPVRISFKTDRPFYPYHEPETIGQNKNERSLRVFFVGLNRVRADIISASKSEKWGARTKYSSELKNYSDLKEFGDLPLRPSFIEDRIRLTAFEDYSSPRRGFGDLYFSPSDEQSSIVPEPIITHTEQTMLIPLDLLAVVGLGIFLMRRTLLHSR